MTNSGRYLTGSEKSLVNMLYQQAKKKGNTKEMTRLKKMYGMFFDLV